MDDNRVEVDDANDSGLGQDEWPAATTVAELDDERGKLVSERLSEKSDILARRVGLLHEYYHFLQFGLNTHDYPMLPQNEGEVVTGRDIFVAKYDLEQHTVFDWTSLMNEDLVFNYERDQSPPLSEDISIHEAPDDMKHSNNTEVASYPMSEPASSPISARSRRRKTSSEREGGNQMDVDEDSALPSMSKLESFKFDDDPSSGRESGSHSEVSKLTPERPQAHEDDEDPLDIISLPINSPSPQDDRPSVPPERETSAVIEEVVDDEDADASAEADDEKEETPEIVEQSTAAVSSQVVKDESPSPSPSPKTPSPLDSMQATTDTMLTSPLVSSKPPPRPVIVRISSMQHEQQPSYSFVEDVPLSLPLRPTQSSPPTRYKTATRYTLPPLSSLPLELQKKSKPSKIRKREKEREKSGSDSGKKDEWTPLGMARWAATLRCNPVYKKVARAAKCVNTRDWNTSMQELKLIRVFDRIELLKDAGRWSFRQPKKQKVVGGLTKTHWDYLLDEMKWLQVDFKEERRWKIAVAYELAQDVLDWHAAASWKERVRLGICSGWVRPSEHEDVDDEMEVDDVGIPELEADPQLEESEAVVMDERIADDDSDDGDHEDNSHDQQSVDDTLQPSTVAAEAVDDADAAVAAQESSHSLSMAPKLEEIDASVALRVSPTPEEGMDVDINSSSEAQNGEESSTKVEGLDSSALKGTSGNPMLDAPSDAVTSQNGPSGDDLTKMPPERVQTLRSALLSLPDDALFVDFSSLSLDPQSSCDGPKKGLEVSQEIDLTIIFPELQPFGLVDLTSSDIVNTAPEGKKKNDKKADKEDPTKRTDETTCTKIYPTGVFMRTKPTLLSALQPARKWRKGKWINLDESPVVSDVDGPPPLISEPSSSALFEPRKQNIIYHQHPMFLPGYQKDPRKRAAEVPWSPSEDNMLKKWVERYPNNWRLVADVMNAARLRSKADLRTPYECFERWKSRWATASRAIGSAGGSFTSLEDGGASPFTAFGLDSGTSQPPTPVTASSSQMTTRGIKRMANSTASTSSNLTINTHPNSVEARKRRRHTLVYDAMRRVSKKRDIHFKQILNIKKQTGPVHDTHLQYDGKQKYTPQELSRLKAEKDNEEKILMQRRQEELRRHHAMQMRAQQLQMQGQIQNDPARMQAAAAAAAAAGMQQTVPQIRSNQVNISQQQQQKMPTQPGAAPPMSPQTMLQAQQMQARALAQAQAQVQQTAQIQQQNAQLQGQVVNASGMNGVPQVASLTSRGGAASPHSQQSSPPRSTATPVNAANFPRPTSAQRPSIAGATGIPMTGGQVSVPGNPIARHSNNLAAYFATGQVSQEHMAQMLRFLPQQQNMALQQQHAQLQMSQQHQQQQQLQQQSPQQNGFAS